ncbi:hypothetical protein CKO25_20195 [Thiocapsa imhoffii]|uniref:Transposase zinc-ribbon domain-containing protein n=1 Tax=Thiocapsa imhoffii TaxID=382777 RepID=A0A9X0WLX8_9GAMM|nr:hypothetical protein [Thiocapsa imhoffii]
MSLNDFFARYDTEAHCAGAQEESRWPQGFVCPRCGATSHSPTPTGAPTGSARGGAGCRPR